MRARWCQIAVGLWIVTIGAAAWLFIRGWTAPGTDQRTVIVLAPSERELILAEMRQLLKAVHGIVDGLASAEPDRPAMAEAARAAGMGMAADVNPAIMAKLPLPFKQMGMSIHQDMDALADAVIQHETPPKLLKRVASMTARCTTCHDLYQLSGGE